MTITNRYTGDLYLNNCIFTTNTPDGEVTFNVDGHSQGYGGEVTVSLNGGEEEKIIVGPMTKVEIYGKEFFGEYADHPRKDETPVSMRYPERK